MIVVLSWRIPIGITARITFCWLPPLADHVCSHLGVVALVVVVVGLSLSLSLSLLLALLSNSERRSDRDRDNES